MTTASPSALDDFLETFIAQVDSGFGLLQGDVNTIFGTLVVISVGITALLWAVDEHHNVTATLIRKVLLVGFFAWLITNWHNLTTTVVSGFAALGLKAGTGGLALHDFMNAPSRVVTVGFGDAFEILKYIDTLCRQAAGFGLFGNFAAVLVASVAAIGLIIAFIILGVEVAVTIIEFHIVTLIAFVTVPFGVLTQTSFLSERAIGYVAAVGLKLMALALIVSIGESVFKTYVVSPVPTINEFCGLLLASVLMVMLAIKIPGIAGALISGGPQLSAGSALAGAAGVAAGVGGAVMAGRAAAGAISKVASASAAAGAVPSGRPGSSPGASSSAGGGSPPAPYGGSAGGGSGGGGPSSPRTNGSPALRTSDGRGTSAAEQAPAVETPQDNPRASQEAAAPSRPASAAEAIAATTAHSAGAQAARGGEAAARNSAATSGGSRERASPAPADTIAAASRRRPTISRLAAVEGVRAAASAHRQGGGGGMSATFHPPQSE